MGGKRKREYVVVICGSPSQVRTAFYHYFTLFKGKQGFICDFGCKLVRYGEDNITISYQICLPDMKVLMGKFFDEVILYGTVKEHPNYRDVLDYVRTHSRKVGEF